MRVSVYIDNSNVFKSIQKIRQQGGPSLGWVQLYNPLELARKLVGSRDLVSVYFYCVPPPPWLLSENQNSRDRHATASRYYSAIGKLPNVEVKYGYLQGDKKDPQEKNVDTQICSDMITHGALGQYDAAILVSNDGDFQSAISNLGLLGKRVELLFFKGYVSDSLRRSCDLVRRARMSHFVRLDI